MTYCLGPRYRSEELDSGGPGRPGIPPRPKVEWVPSPDGRGCRIPVDRRDRKMPDENFLGLRFHPRDRAPRRAGKGSRGSGIRDDGEETDDEVARSRGHDVRDDDVMEGWSRKLASSGGGGRGRQAEGAIGSWT